MPNVLALTKYGALAASTRQRFLQYGDALSKAGIELTVSAFFGDDHVARIGNRGGSAFHALEAFARRIRALASNRADLLWVHCELLPYLPGFIERIGLKRDIPVVFDYDDAIFHNYDRHWNPLVRWALGKKLHALMLRADAVIAGNEYLAQYARPLNARTLVIPTVVDTTVYRPAQTDAHSLTVGWIGSPTTYEAYVRPMLGPVAKACRSQGARFLVVGAGRNETPQFDGMELRPWSEQREVADIQEMDVGIMPLPDDPWARGKCGYKLVQYMACGVPTVASPVGVNVDLADGGRTGLLATGEDEWTGALTRLLSDRARRAAMGSHGRALVVDRFSLQAQAPRLVALFEELLGARARADR